MLDRLAKYNVVWDSPSKDASGSMPLGNGDIGANVWVEPGGDLLLLIGASGAWDENASLLKVGRLRIKFSPNPLTEGAKFKQTLNLALGEIQISMGTVAARIWAPMDASKIQVEVESESPIEMQVELEMWRTAPQTVKTQTGDIFKNLNGKDPYPTVVWPDHVLSEPDQLIWCHHNEPREHDGFAINMQLQGLGDLIEQIPHPLLGRTFGAAVEGEGLLLKDPTTLVSQSPSRRHLVTTYVLTLGSSTIEQWRDSARSMGHGEILPVDADASLLANREWWGNFWGGSYVFIDAPDAFHVTQSYLLQRFMNACAGYGDSPIKHNGSIFSYGKPDDPDFRRWGAGHWFMNQRLIYWPMLASGDFDLMRNWFAMYRNSLELQRHRTRTYFRHGGAHYPETIFFWGAEVSAHYGWTPFEQRQRPEAECPYLTYYWSGGIELVLIMLAFFEYTADESFARETLLPVADAVTEFFDLHYPRDVNGKMRFEPAQALETWHEAINPLPEIAGLRYLLPRLLQLEIATPERKSRWTRMLGELPEIPTAEKDGNRVILPAERFDKKKNTENPELYAIFPYRIHGVGKPDLELARDTFAARLHQSHECWSQDDIQMALLGLTDQAKQWITRRAAPDQHSDSRFPAFWNAHKDWCPDVDHGGVLQLALQFMLMQCEGREIRLLPAWPKEWDVDFKLHAPFQTIVEAKVRGGEVIELKVTPESRRADVVVGEQQCH